MTLEYLFFHIVSFSGKSPIFRILTNQITLVTFSVFISKLFCSVDGLKFSIEGKIPKKIQKLTEHLLSTLVHTTIMGCSHGFLRFSVLSNTFLFLRRTSCVITIHAVTLFFIGMIKFVLNAETMLFSTSPFSDILLSLC